MADRSKKRELMMYRILGLNLTTGIIILSFVGGCGCSVNDVDLSNEVLTFSYNLSKESDKVRIDVDSRMSIHQLKALADAADWIEKTTDKSDIFSFHVLNVNSNSFRTFEYYRSIKIYLIEYDGSLRNFGNALNLNRYNEPWFGRIKVKNSPRETCESYKKMFAHELLHILGLGHVQQKKNIMYPNTSGSGMHMYDWQIEAARVKL
jgi:hypothetical protein